MTKTKYYLSGTVLAVVLLLVGIWVQAPRIVHANDSNFSDGITVDSTDDTPDANIGNNICDDGAGACTLRAAIQESNATAGTQTIEFNITGTADFTNGGQSGYTITPGTELPSLTDEVIINGYSQPGSQANSSIAPNPLNGRLLIELDGDALTGNGLSIAANDVEVRGLVVNNFDATAIQVGPDSIIQGNYIGVDATGLIAKAVGINNNAINSRVPGATSVLIGGLDPEDRNLIAGNTGSGITPNTGDDNWTAQGNYIGVDATGLVSLALSSPGGAGALSLDNSNGHVVGGSLPGAINVIGASLGHGIAPDNVEDLLIEGNYIGLGYDGITVLGNTISGATGSGIVASNVTGATIKNNRVSGWEQQGIGIVSGASNIEIAGNTSNHNRGSGNITLSGVPGPIADILIVGNKVGVKADGSVDDGSPEAIAGIQIAGNVSNCVIGGTAPEDGNIVAGSNGAGINVSQLSIIGFGTFTPTNNAILGNTIFGIRTGTLYGLPVPGLGIDQNSILLEGITPQSISQAGVTPNDSGDSDTGPNGYINFPVLNSAKQTGTSLALNYNLDAADSPTDEYRVEFFANDIADPSGYGEGQIFLGAVTATNGNGSTATLTLPNGMDLTGKVLSATTTAVDNTTDSGFGSTSEFSAVLGAEVIAVQTTTSPSGSNAGSLGETGQRVFSALALVIILAGSILGVVRASRKKHKFKV